MWQALFLALIFEPIINVTQVISCQLTIGYEGVRDSRVVKVNNILINRGLQQLEEVINNATGKWIVFDFPGNEKVVMKRDHDREMFRIYGVAHRSERLTPGCPEFFDA